MTVKLSILLQFEVFNFESASLVKSLKNIFRSTISSVRSKNDFVTFVTDSLGENEINSEHRFPSEMTENFL